MKPPLGMVIALSFEADRLVGRSSWSRDGAVCCPEAGLMVIRSGVGADRALRAARLLVSEGVGALVTVGISAGLCPGVKPGGIIVADDLLLIDANKIAGTWHADDRAAAYAYEKLASRGLSVCRGRIVTLREPLLVNSKKSDLSCRFEALAADMESAAVASAASEARIPFFALRAVCDPARQSVPPPVYKALGIEGNLRYPYLIAQVLKKPSLCMDLVPMALHRRAACRALETAWSILNAGKLVSILIPPP